MHSLAIKSVLNDTHMFSCCGPGGSLRSHRKWWKRNPIISCL